MLATYFSVSKMLGHLRRGPSGPYLDGFAAAFVRQGYSAGTAVRYLRAAAHLGHVVARQGAMPSDIDLAAFSEHLRTCRCPRAIGRRRNQHTIFGAKLFRQHFVESRNSMCNLHHQGSTELHGAWIEDIANRTGWCAAGDNTPTHSTTIHHDRRDDKEANERKTGSLPDDINIHGVLRILASFLV
jgi:hypothetical protein